MNYQDNILLVCLFFVISIFTATGLRCHECNTINPGEEDCLAIAEGVTKYLTNCTPPRNQSCRIQEQWVDFSVLNQTHEKRTIRQCAGTEFDEDRPCYYRTGFGGKVNVCNCIGDGCNEASKTASTIILTIGLLLLVGLIS